MSLFENSLSSAAMPERSSKVHLPRFLQIFRPPPAIISQKGAGLIRAVIYLDVLLLVNFLTTALFLLAAGLLCGVSTSGGRVVGGALAGAAASLILLAPALPWPVSVGYQLASGAGIVLLGYGFPGARCFLRASGIVRRPSFCADRSRAPARRTGQQFQRLPSPLAGAAAGLRRGRVSGCAEHPAVSGPERRAVFFRHSANCQRIPPAPGLL